MTSNRKTYRRNLRWDRWYRKIAHRVTAPERLGYRDLADQLGVVAEPGLHDDPVVINPGFIGPSRRQRQYISRR